MASADPRTGEVVRFFDPRREMNVPERIAERRLLQVLGRYPVR